MRRLARLNLQSVEKFENTIGLPNNVRPVGVFLNPEGDDLIVETDGLELPADLSPWVARRCTIEHGPFRNARIGDGAYRPMEFWSMDRIPVLLPIRQVHAIARVCHEANRAWCEINGDESQRPWALADGWQTQSAIRGVMFRLENPRAPDSATHDAWSADKISEGWRYGEVKDPSARTHPCLVPFDELPAEQRMKDVLFGALVRSMAAAYLAAPST